MTPKQKAEHLVGFYLIKVNSLSCISDAKICSLIAIEEITNALEKNGSWNSDYWQEVKKEINNL
jgi:hypothetical protein